MIKKPVKIRFNDDFEARAIALVVQEANQYSSSIYIETENKKINAKSIMGMMSLQLSEGEEIFVTAEGEDEATAAAGVENIMLSRK